MSKKNRLLLAVLSGLLLGFSYPPVPTGILAMVAFVPFFLVLEPIERYGKALRYAYLTFLVFNLAGLYWTGGFTHGRDQYLMMAGGMLILAHPFFFLIPLWAWMFFKRYFGFRHSLVAFPIFWVAFEYLHSLWEVSFPWLTLGNTQTYDLSFIQYASFTGVYGVSFLVLVINVLVCFLVLIIRDGDVPVYSRRVIFTAIAILAAVALPKYYGMRLLDTPEASSGRSVRIASIQPNIDPFEKWRGKEEDIVSSLQSLTNSVQPHSVDLMLWPETAVPFTLLEPAEHRSLESIRNEIDSLGIPLLTGIPDLIHYPNAADAPPGSKHFSDGEAYETFNGSVLLQPHSDTLQRYSKMVLVPFAERVPYSEYLSFLNAAQWNFGMGGWGIGRDTTVFRFRTQAGAQVNFSNMICYESAYPDLVAAFVRKGAEFLTVVTNDSWWGNTSGAYQHRQIAVLRAVENRRWIVQCANGGISFIVDPFGRIREERGMYSRGVLMGTITTNDDLSFYSSHGDWFAELCVMLSLFLITAGLGSKIYTRIRGIQEKSDMS
ncbi:MAG TPA: apolipoprotein N-acyltransferase [Bacteroidota bacterium]|nr:apolipoprotein N-acyltransferase [Bacteroidota bacterium]